jgi:hypothetical protein
MTGHCSCPSLVNGISQQCINTHNQGSHADFLQSHQVQSSTKKCMVLQYISCRVGKNILETDREGDGAGKKY